MLDGAAERIYAGWLQLCDERVTSSRGVDGGRRLRAGSGGSAAAVARVAVGESCGPRRGCWSEPRARTVGPRPGCRFEPRADPCGRPARWSGRTAHSGRSRHPRPRSRLAVCPALGGICAALQAGDAAIPHRPCERRRRRARGRQIGRRWRARGRKSAGTCGRSKRARAPPGVGNRMLNYSASRSPPPAHRRAPPGGDRQWSAAAVALVDSTPTGSTSGRAGRDSGIHGHEVDNRSRATTARAPAPDSTRRVACNPSAGSRQSCRRA